jgi:hypothetical protein
MPGVFKNLARQDRGKSNLGGMARLVAFAESDFTEGWPRKDQITDGVLTVVPPLKDGVVGAELVFDHSTGRGKSAKKGALGYQNYEHEVDAKFAGCDPTQLAALQNFLNEGGVVVGYYKDGKRRVFGASWNPLVIEDSDDSGAKADDQNAISFKGKGEGYDFHAPFLAPATLLPTDALAVKPMPFALD